MGGCGPRGRSACSCKRYSVVVGRNGVTLYEINVGGDGSGLARQRPGLNGSGKVRYINCCPANVDQTFPSAVSFRSDESPSFLKAGVLEVRFLKKADGQPASVVVTVRKNP